MEDIRQFQTKEERANDELRRIMGLGLISNLQLLPPWEDLDRLAEARSKDAKADKRVFLTSRPTSPEELTGRQPCRQPNLPKYPRGKVSSPQGEVTELSRNNLWHLEINGWDGIVQGQWEAIDD